MPISYKESIRGGFPEGTVREKPTGELQTLKRLPIDQLVYTPGNKLYQETIQKYVDHPPAAHPEALFVRGEYVLEDGNHRVAAAEDRGEEDILVWVGEVPKWERRNPKKEKFNAAFWKWFGKSKVVSPWDGKPEIVFHGTTHDFDSFKPERAHVENDLGAGFYFSNTAEDVNENYAGIGPDLTGRIERLAEQLQDSEDVEDYDEAIVLATKELSGGKFSVMPCYLSIQKPVQIGDNPFTGEKETVFDLEEEYDEETEEYGDVSGSFVEFLDALDRVAGGFYTGDLEKLRGDLFSEAMDWQGMKASELIQKVKEHDSMLDAQDEYSGDHAAAEIIRQAFEDMGFDGIIDFTVDKKFGSQKRLPRGVSGKATGMKGMHAETVHYIAFKPTQIKSAIGNRGTWDPKDPNVTHNPPPKSYFEEMYDKHSRDETALGRGLLYEVGVALEGFGGDRAVDNLPAYSFGYNMWTTAIEEHEKATGLSNDAAYEDMMRAMEEHGLAGNETDAEEVAMKMTDEPTDELREEWERQGMANNPSAQEVEDSVEHKYEPKWFTLHDRSDGTWKLSMFEIPKDRRKQGIGTKIMQELVDAADEEGKRIVLDPGLRDPLHGTTSRSRLVKFYKRFGFVENKGRKKDFRISEGMYRDPKRTNNPPKKFNAAFWKWFGNSKVVDENGDPLVVYHGTHKNFTEFDLDYAAQGIFWFSSDKSKIAGGRSGAVSSKIIVEAYLSIQNPAGWDEYEKYSLGQIRDMGFDGIQLDDDYVVFEPTQIKSATGNRGTWSKTDPNIMHNPMPQEAYANAYTKRGKTLVLAEPIPQEAGDARDAAMNQLYRKAFDKFDGDEIEVEVFQTKEQATREAVRHKAKFAV